MTPQTAPRKPQVFFIDPFEIMSFMCMNLYSLQSHLIYFFLSEKTLKDVEKNLA
jgi:hypothetical protein